MKSSQVLGIKLCAVGFALYLCTSCSKTAPTTALITNTLTSGTPPGTSTITPATGLYSIPVGLDAYLKWGDLPYLRPGIRALMVSTYDRTGQNVQSDAGSFLRQESAPSYKSTTSNIIVDEEGSAGVLYFGRQNTFHGTPMHILPDGKDFVFQEIGTHQPYTSNTSDLTLVNLFSGNFTGPLCLPHSVSQGADLEWLPIPFESALKIGYEHVRYSTGYFILHKILGDYPVSTPVTTWDGTLNVTKFANVNTLLNSSGSDLTATLPSGSLSSLSGTVTSLAQDSSNTLLN